MRSASCAQPSSPYRRSCLPTVAEALAVVLPAARPLLPASAHARRSDGRTALVGVGVRGAEVVAAASRRAARAPLPRVALLRFATALRRGRSLSAQAVRPHQTKAFAGYSGRGPASVRRCAADHG